MPRRHLELDLLVIDVLTLLLVVVVLALPIPFLREILGLLCVLFSPGYVLVAAIFPGQKSLGTTTRLSLSLGLSIAVGVFIGLILGVTPWGFTLNSILVAMVLFTLVTSCLAWYLRNRHNQGNKSTIKSPSFFSEAIQSFRSAGWGYRSLVIILLCVLFGSFGSICYVMVRPLPAQPFSECYILGTGGKAEAYPRELHAGEEGRVNIGIVNHETQETNYRVQVKVDGAQLYELPVIRLSPNERWQREVGFTLQKVGKDQKVEFLLYTDANVPYETRYIWINVTE